MIFEINTLISNGDESSLQKAVTETYFSPFYRHERMKLNKENPCVARCDLTYCQNSNPYSSNGKFFFCI
uniref:Uncharacterized protein n=1 Tax=Cannabis sativa TaxID=3483 RepID=A0A803QTA1_CANSA